MKTITYRQQLLFILKQHLKNFQPVTIAGKSYFAQGKILWCRTNKQQGLFYIKYPFIQAVTTAYHESFSIYSYFDYIVRPEFLFCGPPNLKQELTAQVIVNPDYLQCCLLHSGNKLIFNIYPKIYQPF